MDAKVTIKDIAEATGVSASTVSRIINGNGKYREETKKKIWDAVKEMKYTPNILAKSLRSGRSVLIGIMLPEIDSNFFGVLANRLVQELIRCKFVPVVCTTFNDGEIESGYCRMLASMHAGAIIYIHKETPIREEAADIPSIFIGSAPQAEENSVRILFDIIGGAKKATEELIESGCRRIVYIRSARHRVASIGRYLGYQQVLWENSVPVDEALVVTIGGGNYASVAEALDGLREKGISFDGIFSNTVSNSIEALNYLKKHAYRIPEDVKLVSFENGKSAEFFNPGISAIEMDSALTCEAAVSSLQEVLREEEPVKKTLRIPAVLHVRETSGRATEE